MFDDLPPDLDRLHTLRVWHTMWLQRIDAKIAALTRRQTEEERGRRNRPAPPEWIIELGIERRPPLQIHTGDDCHMAGKRHRPVDRDEARRLLRRMPMQDTPLRSRRQPSAGMVPDHGTRELARRIGRMPKEQQAEAAELAINAVEPPRQRGPKAEEAAAVGPSSPSTVNGVNTLDPEARGSGASPSTVNAVNTLVADAEATTEAGTRQPRKLPYDNPTCVVQLHVKMTSADFTQGARAWLRILRDEHPEEYRALLLELFEEQQPA
ncbi:DUF6233 domain-containing protein [Streptomyces pseudogriseolus]|uniref:DUF6233 domain-containing protein n=1 Tax=Streptomyces pseudogriseolus TaxID=36817 RepID=UPI003FA22264